MAKVVRFSVPPSFATRKLSAKVAIPIPDAVRRGWVRWRATPFPSFHPVFGTLEHMLHKFLCVLFHPLISLCKQAKVQLSRLACLLHNNDSSNAGTNLASSPTWP